MGLDCIVGRNKGEKGEEEREKWNREGMGSFVYCRKKERGKREEKKDRNEGGREWLRLCIVGRKKR